MEGTAEQGQSLREDQMKSSGSPDVSDATTHLLTQRPHNRFPVIALSFFIVIFIGAMGAYLLREFEKRPGVLPEGPFPTAVPTTLPTATSTISPIQTTDTLRGALLSGHITKRSDDLQLFRNLEDVSTPVYYDIGTFTQGSLTGYHRVLAINLSSYFYEPGAFILATKDYKSFILDDPHDAVTVYPLIDSRNPYYYLDKTKIESTRDFDSELPETLNLDSRFSLILSAIRFPTEQIATGNKDPQGFETYNTVLVTDFSAYESLTSPVKGLKMFYKPFDNFIEDTDQISDQERLRQQYVRGETEVIVIDSVGLPMEYLLTTPEKIEQYEKEMAASDSATRYIPRPSMYIDASDISAPSDMSFYKEYGKALPRKVSTSPYDRIVDVSDDELEEIGRINNIPLFQLKDTNHPLYDLAYHIKVDWYTDDPERAQEVFPDLKIPTLQEYVAAHPLLFFKDYWGRWVAVGENDIPLPAAGGKPVVYLYPTEPTDVVVMFQAPVQFATVVPNYVDSWKVRAYPDGTLVDLKPELTDCLSIDTNKFGSEYAFDSCIQNRYPYLYWSGNITSHEYPRIDSGWVVEQDELDSFLRTKLTEMGFNPTERSDFLEYWLTDMLSKEAPYYRVSFLQTNEVNGLFPMSVSPQPDTVFRIFLDYTPLAEKPLVAPPPQILKPIVRRGFTLVEWGGKKIP